MCLKAEVVLEVALLGVEAITYLRKGFFLVMQQITNTVSLLKFQQTVQFSSVIFKKAFQDITIKNIMFLQE